MVYGYDLVPACAGLFKAWNCTGDLQILSNQFGFGLKTLWKNNGDSKFDGDNIMALFLSAFLDTNCQFGDVAGARSPNWRSGDFWKKNFFFTLKLPNSSRNQIKKFSRPNE